MTDIEHRDNHIQNPANQVVKAGILTRELKFLPVFSVMGLVQFLGSGNLAWIRTCLFLGIGLLSVDSNSFFVFHHIPETIAEDSIQEKSKNGINGLEAYGSSANVSHNLWWQPWISAMAGWELRVHNGM